MTARQDYPELTWVTRRSHMTRVVAEANRALDELDIVRAMVAQAQAVDAHPRFAATPDVMTHAPGSGFLTAAEAAERRATLGLPS